LGESCRQFSPDLLEFFAIFQLKTKGKLKGIPAVRIQGGSLNTFQSPSGAQNGLDSVPPRGETAYQ